MGSPARLTAIAVLLASLALLPTASAGAVGGDPDVTVRRVADPPDVRPGPDILYEPPARAPQLRATGMWQASTRLVSGASAYDAGEFLYTDYLYDDRGDGSYAYPDDPALTKNDADFVELRLREVDDGLAVRLTFQSLESPGRV